MDSLLIGTVSGANGLVINVYAIDDGNGGVKITLDVASGYADLRGFFLDWNDMPNSLSTDDISGSDVTAAKVAEEGVSKLSSETNMNGTGEIFDMGVQFGTAGIGKDDIGETSFTIAGISLDDLDGVTFGVRLMSTGINRDGSEKLLGVLDVPDEPPPQDHFPDFLPKDISHVVLYFDGNGDGMVDLHNPLDFTIKIDNWIDHNPPANGDDVDLYLQDILDHIYSDADLLAAQPNLLTADLLGASIKAGSIGAGGYNNFYALDNNPNDVDAFPSDYNDGSDTEVPPFDVTNPGPHGALLADGDPIENQWITHVVEYTDVFPIA